MSPRIPEAVAGRVADTEAAGSGFTPIPDGIYGARLKDVEVTETKAGDPMWKWTFEILEGEEYEGRLFWSNSTFGDKALPFFKKTLLALGVDADDPVVVKNLDTDTLLGQWVSLSIDTRVIPEGQKNAGKLQNNVAEVLPYEDDESDGPQPGE